MVGRLNDQEGGRLKKLISLLLVLAVVLSCVSLIACSGGEGGGTTPPPSEGGAAPPTTEAGLAAYYTFDGDTEDHSGNGNHATNNGATFVSGHSGQALNFDGTDDFVTAPVDINPDVMPQMTMSAWVKPADGSPIRLVISHDAGGYDRSLGIDKRGGGTGWSAFAGTGAVLGYHPVEVGEWAFIAVAYDQNAGTVKLYVNGAMYEKEGTLGAGQKQVCIGSNPSFRELFSGVIDEVKIYDYALSNAELNSLRETGSTRTSATPTPTDGGTTDGGTTGDGTLSEIIARGANLPPVKYDQLFTSQGMPTQTWEIWLKGQKSRIEMTADGEDVVMLVDLEAKIAYMYSPAENMAIKMDLSSFEGIVTKASDDIMDYNPIIIGTETLDGKVCLVIEYTVVAEGVESKIKQWLWTEHGFPIRTETTSGGKSAVMECRNIEFGDIPDSMFELPPGTSIMGMSD